MEVVPRYRFEAMIADALDDLPDELHHVLDNVVVQAVDRHSGEPDLLGLYEGTPHTERSGMEGPDVVSIFRIPLCPARRLRHVSSALPRHDTMPSPVTTTRCLDPFAEVKMTLPREPRDRSIAGSSTN